MATLSSLVTWTHNIPQQNILWNITPYNTIHFPVLYFPDLKCHVLCNVMMCCAFQMCCVVFWCIVFAVLCRFAMLCYFAVLCRFSVLCCVLQYCAVFCRTVFCLVVLCCAVFCCSVLCCAAVCCNKVSYQTDTLSILIYCILLEGYYIILSYTLLNSSIYTLYTLNYNLPFILISLVLFNQGIARQGKEESKVYSTIFVNIIDMST